MKTLALTIAVGLVTFAAIAGLQLRFDDKVTDVIEKVDGYVSESAKILSSHGVKIESQADAIQKLEQRVKVLEDRPQTQGYFYYTPTPAWTNYPFRIPIQLDGTNIFILEGTNHVISVPCTTGAK